MDVRDVICAFCEMGREEEKERVRVPVERAMNKYTYELPSGRKVTVVMDDEGEVVGALA